MTSPNSIPRRRTGGSAGTGGYEFQAQVIAYVAAHMLAGRTLGWLVNGADLPVEISAETGRAGDDLRVRLAETPITIEAQVKRGLAGQAKLTSALAQLLSELAEDEQGLLIVDPRTPNTIAFDLPEDLQRIRERRFDELREMAAAVRSYCDEQQIPHAVLDRLHVIQLATERRHESDRKAAIGLLMPLVGEEGDADRLWDTLVIEGLEVCKRRGALTKAGLTERLRAKGIRLSSGHASDPTLQEILTIVRQLPGASSIAMATELAAGPDLAGEGPFGTWHAEIDTARELITGHTPAAGLAVLRAIERRLGDVDVEPAVRRRLHANIGVALVRLERPSEALDEMRRAYDMDPNDGIVLANLASLHHLLGHGDDARRAARAAITKSSGQASAWGVLIELGDATASDVPADLASSPEVLTSLALRAQRVSDRGQAIEAARSALQIGGRSPERLYLVAQALIAYKGPDEMITPPSPAEYEESIALASEALALLEGADAGPLVKQLLMLRAVTHRSLRNLAEAAADAERARFIAESLRATGGDLDWRPGYLLGSVLLDLEQASRALDVLKPYMELAGHELPLRMVHARALLKAGRVEDGQAALVRILEATRGTPEENEATFICVEAVLDANLTELAERVLAEAGRDRVPWLFDLYTARIAGMRGEVERALASFASAAAVAPNGARPAVHLEAAGYSGSVDRFDEAVAHFEAADAWHLGGGSRGRYLAALWEAGRGDVAAERLDELACEGDLPLWALPIAAQVAWARGDLDEATTHFRRLLAARPESTSAALNLVQAYARRGRTKRAAVLARRLSRSPSLGAHDRMRLAAFMVRLGFEAEGIAHAFRALRLADDDVELKSAYLGIFLRPDQAGRSEVAEQLTNVRTIGPDTVSTLRPVTGGASIEYTLLAEGPVNWQHNEFLATDSRVVFLVGRQVGDEVVVAQGLPSARSYRIAEIKSAAVHAFQQLLLRFPEQHPDHQGIQRFELDPELSPASLLPIISVLHRQSARGEQVLRLYSEQVVPVGSIAMLLSRSEGDTYLALAQREPGLRVQLGDEASQAATMQAASSNAAIVITRTAVATCQRLLGVGIDMLSKVAEFGRTIYVPHSLVEQLQHELQEFDDAIARGGASTLVAAPSGLQMIETPADALARERSFLSTVVEAIRRETEVVARSASTLSGRVERMRTLIGPTGFDAVDIATLRGAVLWADDLGLRGMASRDRVPTSTVTYALLAVAEEQGRLTAEARARGVIELLKLRQTFTPLNAELLHAGLRAKSFSMDDSDIRLLLEGLKGPDVDVYGAVRTAVELLRKVSVEPIGGSALRPLASAVVTQLCEARRIAPTLSILRELLNRRFYLLPPQREEIEKVISGIEAAMARTRTLR